MIRLLFFTLISVALSEYCVCESSPQKYETSIESKCGDFYSQPFSTKNMFSKEYFVFNGGKCAHVSVKSQPIYHVYKKCPNFITNFISYSSTCKTIDDKTFDELYSGERYISGFHVDINGVRHLKYNFRYVYLHLQ